MIASAKKPDDRFHVRTQREVAAFVARDERTVRRWKQMGMPGDNTAGYDLCEITRWALDNIAAGDDAPEDDGESLVVQKLRAEIVKLRADGAAKELKVETMRGDLVSRTDAEQSLAELCAIIRTRIEAIPDELEMRFPAETRAENRIDVENYTRKLLTEMSQTQIY